MIFNSLEFLCFIGIVIALYHVIERTLLARNLLLIVVSFAFYAAWYWQYSLLLVASIVVDYTVGRLMGVCQAKRHRQILLIVSLTTNIGLLGFFKYANFFADLSEHILLVFGYDLSFFRSTYLLPIGISFYTFQSLSYSIDVYRRKIDPEKSILDFAAFVSFFPQLVAGPILRASQFLPQLKHTINITPTQVKLGVFLILCGLIKKVIFADNLGLLVVEPVFFNPSEFSSLDLLMGLYGYAFQIYCDFSGYSDIAIGLALLLGFSIPANFNRPYLALTPSDFWRRWHISLSSWLRDYLYIPLGGNRKGLSRTQINLLLTMLLGGLWHGAAWNFVLWGIYQGGLLMMYRPFESRLARANRYLLWLIMFHLTVFGWLIFRAPDLATLTAYVSGLTELDFSSRLSALVYVLLMAIGIAHFVPRNTAWASRFRNRWAETPGVFVGVAAAFMIVLLYALAGDSPQFVYFQF